MEPVVVLRCISLSVYKRKIDVENHVHACLKRDDIDFKVYYPIPCDLVSATGTRSGTKKSDEEYADAVVHFVKAEDADKLRKLCPTATEISFQIFSVVSCTISLECVTRMSRKIRKEDILTFLEEESGVNTRISRDGLLKLIGTQWQVDIAHYHIKQIVESKTATDFGVVSHNGHTDPVEGDQNVKDPLHPIQDHPGLRKFGDEHNKPNVKLYHESSEQTREDNNNMNGDKRAARQCNRERAMAAESQNGMKYPDIQFSGSFQMHEYNTGSRYSNVQMADENKHQRLVETVGTSRRRNTKDGDDVHLSDYSNVQQLASIKADTLKLKDTEMMDVDEQPSSNGKDGDQSGGFEEKGARPKKQLIPDEFKQEEIQVDSVFWEYIQCYGKTFLKQLQKQLDEYQINIKICNGWHILSGQSQNNLSVVKRFISDHYRDFVYIYSGSGPVGAVGPAEDINKYHQEMANRQNVTREDVTRKDDLLTPADDDQTTDDNGTSRITNPLASSGGHNAARMKERNKEINDSDYSPQSGNMMGAENLTSGEEKDQVKSHSIDRMEVLRKDKSIGEELKREVIQVDSLHWKFIQKYETVFEKQLLKQSDEYDVKVTERGDRIILSGQSQHNLSAVKRFISDHYRDFVYALERISLSAERDRQVLERYCSRLVYAHSGSGPVDAVGPADDINRYRRETAKSPNVTREAFTLKDDIVTHHREMVDMSRVTNRESTIPGLNTSSDNRSVTPVMTMSGRYPVGFDIFNRTKLIVHKCDITKLNVDAVVNAANGGLHHGGGVAAAIAKAAGPELEKECKQYIREHRYIQESELAVTTGGEMPCCKVIHAVGPTWSKSNNQLQERCRLLLQNTFQNILKRADKENFKSLAMPAISSGVFGVPQNIVADVIGFAIMSYGPHQCLEEIHLVDVADDMLSLLSKQFYNQISSSVAELDRSTVESIIRKRTFALPIGFTIDCLTEIYVYPHNITKLKVDAIVCPADKSLSHSWGLAKVIADKAGWDFQEVCRKRGKEKKLHSSDVIPIQPPNLPLILYAVTPNESRLNWSSDKELKTMFSNILDGARKNGIHTLALPPIGAGASATKVGEILCSALLDGLRDDRQIKVIHIVDLKTDGLKSLVQEIIKRGNRRVELISDSVVQAQMSVSTGSKIPTGASGVGTTAGHIDDQKEVVYSSDYRKNRPAHKSPDKDVTKSQTNNSNDAMDMCVICMIEPPTNPKVLPKCKHVFCTHCIDESFKKCGPKCPSCGEIYGDLTGNQPANGTMNVSRSPTHLPGYNTYGSIVISYHFPSGKQGAEHPNPGIQYTGASRTAYIPDNKKGKHVLGLLQRAFKARLVFTIGRSTTTGQDNMVTWNDIHHKTNMHGGQQHFGYPDDTYLTRVQQELAAKGIK